MSYLTLDELREQVDDDVAPMLEALSDLKAAALLELAARDVDTACGGIRDPITGRATDLAICTPAQVSALKLATLEAACFRLADPGAIRGSSELLGDGLTVARRAASPPTPATTALLAGLGLIRRTLTVAPSPPALRRIV